MNTNKDNGIYVSAMLDVSCLKWYAEVCDYVRLVEDTTLFDTQKEALDHAETLASDLVWLSLNGLRLTIDPNVLLQEKENAEFWRGELRKVVKKFTDAGIWEEGTDLLAKIDELISRGV